MKAARDRVSISLREDDLVLVVDALNELELCAGDGTRKETEKQRHISDLAYRFSTALDAATMRRKADALEVKLNEETP